MTILLRKVFLNDKQKNFRLMDIRVSTRFSDFVFSPPNLELAKCIVT